MLVRTIARDRQARPGSARFARSRRLDAIIGIEDPFHLRFRYSGTAVAHADHGLIPFTLRDNARITAVFHRVVDQIGKAALQSDRNPQDRSVRLTTQSDV